jgi:hypothetical protein
MNIRQIVSEGMRARKLTANKLAKLAKIPPRTLYGFLDKSPINSDHLGRILKALDLEIVEPVKAEETANQKAAKHHAEKRPELLAMWEIHDEFDRLKVHLKRLVDVVDGCCKTGRAALVPYGEIDEILKPLNKHRITREQSRKIRGLE